MQPQGHKKRPRYKHDRRQSNLNPTSNPISRHDNPSKIQVNVLFVYFVTRPIFATNSLTYRNFQMILAHSILYISFFCPYLQQLYDSLSRLSIFFFCRCANFTPVYYALKGGKMQEKRVGLSLGAKLNSLVFFVLILLCRLSIPLR